MAEITKADKIMYHVGYAGIIITAFAWGWNMINFKFNKKA